MLSNAHKKLLGSECSFVLLPHKFKESITNHFNYDYKQEGIDVLNSSVAELGRFWRFIEGAKYFDISIGNVLIEQKKGQNSACLVPLLYGVDRILIESQKDKKEVVLENSLFRKIGVAAVDFDFDNPIEKITLYFNYDLAEPLEIDINTILYKEPEIDYSKLYLENLKLSHSTGNDLVNIRFQNANEEVDKTIVELYIKDKNEFQTLSRYEIPNSEFFKSITGLAYGTYGYNVSQYDKENNIIISTDIKEFALYAPVYGGKPVIDNR